MSAPAKEYGEHTFPDGRVYKGYWESGKMHGDGVMHFSDGRMYKGQWCAGTPALPQDDPCFGLDLDSPVDLSAPLDARDVAIVQQTWSRVASLGAETVGKVLFSQVFKVAPEAIALFPFKDVPQNELYAAGGALEKYGRRIVTTVDRGIKNLDDLVVLVPILKTAVPPLFPGATKEH